MVDQAVRVRVREKESESEKDIEETQEALVVDG